MNKFTISVLPYAMLIAAPVFAQQVGVPTPAATAAIVATPTGGATILRSGTPIPLRMLEGLTTKGKNLRVGYRVHLEVAEAVMLNGVTVIPAGSPAVGEITDVRNKGMWGKSGSINGQMLYVTVNGRQIRLSGQFDDKGVTGTAGVVAAVAFVPIAGFFTTGTSAKIPAGGAVKGFIDEDVPVVVESASAVMPLTVSAPAPAATSAIAGAPAAGMAVQPASILKPVAAPR